MNYLADPGGVFASDTHRRVLGHLPLPGDDPIKLVEVETEQFSARELRRRSLAHRLDKDPHHGIQNLDALDEILSDLEASGYASKLKDGWKMTKKGFEALTAPVAEEAAGPARPAVLGGMGGDLSG